MARMSISRAWDETKEVLRRDGSLITTVALALLVLPGTISTLLQPNVPRDAATGFSWAMVAQVIALLIGVVGQLAISQIALERRQSVGQAIAGSARRTPVLLAAIVIWILPIILLIAPFAKQLQADPANAGGAALAASLLGVLLLFFFGIRLILTTPIASAEPGGPIAILKRSWALTEGSWWRLFGFLALLFGAAFIAISAVTAVIGVIVNLAGGAPEPWSIGALVLALTAQLLSAAFTVLLVVMIARLYAQATGREHEPASVPHAP